MLVFVDDSGDTNFSLEKGASRAFVIVCIIFDDELEAEKTAVAIKELRRKLKFPDTVEFKFSGSSKKTRLAFLEAIKPFHFRIRALVVKKNKIQIKKLQHDTESFYNFCIKMLLDRNRAVIKNASVRIDGKADRLFRRKFVSYLGKHLNIKENRVFQHVRFVDSRQNVLIQLADMIAGTIRRYMEKEKPDAPDYWKLIKRKIDDCFELDA